jgi:NAD(P)H-dependent FMN reductase
LRARSRRTGASTACSAANDTGRKLTIGSGDLGQYTHQHTRDWSAKVAEADAFVFVMPEYNFGCNAELKKAIDYLHREWQYKPVGLVSYGGVSGGPGPRR